MAGNSQHSAVAGINYCCYLESHLHQSLSTSLKFASTGLCWNVFTSIEEHFVYKSLSRVSWRMMMMQSSLLWCVWHKQPLLLQTGTFTPQQGLEPSCLRQGQPFSCVHWSQLSAEVIKESVPKGEAAEKTHRYFLVSLGLACLSADCFSLISTKAECWVSFVLLVVWWVFLPTGDIPNHETLLGWRRQEKGRQCCRFGTDTELFVSRFL